MLYVILDLRSFGFSSSLFPATTGRISRLIINFIFLKFPTYINEC